MGGMGDTANLMMRRALFLHVSLCLLACGGAVKPEEAPPEAVRPAGAEPPRPAADERAEQAEQVEQVEPPTRAPDLGAPAQPAPGETPTGPGQGVDLVVLHDHVLLGSEKRALDKFVGKLEKKGLKVTRIDEASESRRNALNTWFTTRDAQERADLSRVHTLAESAATIVVRLRKPGGRSGKVAQGQDGVGVLARRDDLLWLQVEDSGLALLGEVDDSLVGLVEGLKGAKG